MSKKQQRIALLEAQILRLQRRIDKLDRLSTNYSWARVAVFFGGLALSLLGGFLLGWWLGLALAAATILAFGLLAHYHGKVDKSLARHSVWSHIKAAHVARMKLDWRGIPSTSAPAPQASQDPQTNHPFDYDLDISGPHSLHQLLNTAVSREGSQRLLAWLLNTEPDLPTIKHRQSLVRELMPLTLFRDKLTMKSLLAAKKLNEQLEGQRLLTWLQHREPSAKLRPLLWLSATLNILTIVFLLLSLFVSMPQLWILTIVASLLLLFVTAKQRGDIFADANYLSYGFSTLSFIFEYLQTYPYGQHRLLKKLCEPFFQQQSPSRLLRSTARISSAATLKGNGLLWLLVNAFVPWDIYCAYRLRQCKEQIAAHLPIWLDTWFELEALSSLAAFAYLNPEYILPDVLPNEQLTTPALFDAHDLGHPLIRVEKKVTNSFALDELGEVVIITGSNMAGKSTFLRTLGVNLSLAYAGGPVNASTFRTSLFRLFTCIRVTDSVTEGYSYFYAEVRRLRAMLTELAQPGSFPLFFLIDEIFKGTNNRERLIGSQSFVHALLGRNCLGAISTHDLELVKLADLYPKVSNYHFREEVVDGAMVFDYTLRPGPCPTTNALKIMRIEGLPVDEDSDSS